MCSGFETFDLEDYTLGPSTVLAEVDPTEVLTSAPRKVIEAGTGGDGFLVPWCIPDRVSR